MAEGQRKYEKYFFIRSKFNNLVVTLQGKKTPDGVPIVSWAEDKDVKKRNKQLWYYDLYTGTIRSKANNLCMDIYDDSVRGCKYKPGVITQLMRMENDQIFGFTPTKEERILEIEKSNFMPGTKIVAFTNMSLPNQQWFFQYMLVRYFKIKNELFGKLLDVYKGDSKIGAKVITWTDKVKESSNQLWYEDKRGIIRSKLNDFGLDSAPGSDFKLMPYEESNTNQQWVFVDNTIRNVTRSQVNTLQVKDKSPFDGSKVISADIDIDPGNLTQKWSKEYI